MSAPLRYLVVRTLLFLVPFTVLMIAQVPPWLSLIVSLAFAFAASLVFFSKLRDEAAADVQRMRAGRRREGAGPDDGDLEDSAIDGSSAVQPHPGGADEQGDATGPDAPARG